MSTNAPKIYDFNLSPGGSQYLPASGAMYKILSCLGAVEIQEDAGASIGPIAVGQGMREREFGALIVRDKSGAANVGQIIVAGTDFINDQLLGSVTINDVNQTRAAQEISFGSWAGIATGGGGQNGLIQLLNIGSAKTIYVSAVSVISDVTLNQLGFYGSATEQMANVSGFGKRLSSGGADSAIGQVRFASRAGLPTAAQAFRVVGVGAGLTHEWRPQTPYKIKPGQMLTIATTANGGVAHNPFVNFEWYES